MFDRMPVLFVGHGSPMNAIEDNEFRRARIAAGSALLSPKASLCISNKGRKLRWRLTLPNTTSRFFTLWEPENRANPSASSRKR
jgi:hypothetical protein